MPPGHSSRRVSEYSLTRDDAPRVIDSALREARAEEARLSIGVQSPDPRSRNAPVPQRTEVARPEQPAATDRSKLI